MVRGSAVFTTCKVAKRATLLGLITTLGLGCEARQTGDRGELIFSYSAWDDVTNFDRPIAAGAALDLRVTRVLDEEQPLHIKRARMSPAPVARVAGVVAHSARVIGLKPGTARLRVRARDEGGALVWDSVRLRVAQVAHVTLSHPCDVTEEQQRAPLYLAAASPARLNVSMRSARQEPLRGWGLAPLQLTVSPAGAATLSDRAEEEGVIDVTIAPDAQRLSITSALSQDKLDYHVITPAALDGIRLAPFLSDSLIALEGEVSSLRFEALSQGQALCHGQAPVQVRSVTPERCSVTSASDDGADGGEAITSQDGRVQVRALRFGLCQLEASLAHAPAAKTRVTLRVGKLPEAPPEEDARAELPAPHPALEPTPDPQADPLAMRQHTLRAEAPRAPARPWWLAPLLALLAPLCLTPLLWRAQARWRVR